MNYYLLGFDEGEVKYIDLFVDFHSAELFSFVKLLTSFKPASKELGFGEAILRFWLDSY
jgi:hypothetical protein